MVHSTLVAVAAEPTVLEQTLLHRTATPTTVEQVVPVAEPTDYVVVTVAVVVERKALEQMVERLELDQLWEQVDKVGLMLVLLVAQPLSTMAHDDY